MKWALILIALAAFNPQADVHWPRWALLQMGLFGYIIYSFKDKYHWSLLFAGFATGISSIIITNWRFNWLYMGKLKLSEIAFVQNVAGQGFMAMVILSIFLTQVSKETLLKIYRGFYYLALAHSLLWISEHAFNYTLWIHNGIPEFGLFGNTSMGSCINGIMFSGIFLKQNKYLKILAPMILGFPIYLAQGSMGYLCLVTNLIVYCCFYWESSKLEKVCMIFGSIGMALFVGQFFDYQFYRFMKIDRWDIWELYLTWWWKNAEFISGAGFGSFSVFGPGIQMMSGFQKYHGGLYLWLHSDILQILFELGALGLISYLTMGFYVIKKAINQKEYILLASVSSYIICMAGNYPTNLALFSFLGLTMCFYLLRSEKLVNQ